MDQPAMRASTPLPQFVLRFVPVVIVIGLASPARAQQSRVVTTPAAVLSSPTGKSIGSVHPGASLRVVETKGAYAKVSIDGFVQRTRLSVQRGQGLTRVGNRAAVIRSKGVETARSVASLDAGTTVVLAPGSPSTSWVRVSREGWVLRSSLDRATTAAARERSAAKRVASSEKSKSAKEDAARSTPSSRKASAGEVASAPAVSRKSPPLAAPAPARPITPAPAAATRSSLGDSTLIPTANVPLRAAPDARALATVAQGTTLIPLARERGWVRVRLEGWVPEKDVAPADTSVRMGVSAADLRADPVGSRGKVVRWSVQILAKQKADALRRDLAPDETYLLARGPYEENALLYLVVPPALLVMAKSVPELSQAMITARVRTGRSELVGVPILDLLTITLRK
jgi:hypothetical protein